MPGAVASDDGALRGSSDWHGPGDAAVSDRTGGTGACAVGGVADERPTGACALGGLDGDTEGGVAGERPTGAGAGARWRCPAPSSIDIAGAASTAATRTRETQSTLHEGMRSASKASTPGKSNP